MKALTLSIVIPVYNEERHIRACLDSIAAQTQAPDEVIVVDNNCTDSSIRIAQEYTFVRVVRQPTQGIVHARNAGFDAAGSNIIGRIDADSVLPPGWAQYVRHFYNAKGRSKSVLTGGGYFYNLRLPRFNGWLQSQIAFRLNRFIIGHYIVWGSNMAFLRTQWLAVRDETCRRDDIHEDLDLGIHLQKRGFVIAYRAHLRVGVFLKRIIKNRKQLRVHMRRWPQTLRSHGYRLWWLGVVGNLFLWFVVQPLMLLLELVAIIFGKRSIVN